MRRWMEELLSRCGVHKLNYRVPTKVLADKHNFYHSIVNVKNTNITDAEIK